MWILRQNFSNRMNGFGIGIDPFAPAPAQAPAAPAQQQQQQMPQNMPQSVPSATIPGQASGIQSNQQDNLNGFGSTQPATGGASPLDNYSTLFDNGNNQRGQGGQQQQQQAQQNQQQQQQQDQQIQEALDLMKYGHSDYQATAANLDFTSGIDSGLFQAALSGDGESLSKLLNSFGRNVFAAAAHSSSKLAGTAIKQNFDQFDKGLAEKFKSFSLTNAQQSIVNNTAPILNNPVIQPMLKQAMQIMSKAYPEATAEEITNHAVKYLQDVSGVINGNQQQAGQQNQQQQQQQDQRGYSDLFGM